MGKNIEEATNNKKRKDPGSIKISSKHNNEGDETGESGKGKKKKKKCC